LLSPEHLFFTDRELQDKIRAYCDTSDSEREAVRGAMRARAMELFDLEETKSQIRDLFEEVRGTWKDRASAGR
jgi:hypothetical protein